MKVKADQDRLTIGPAQSAACALGAMLANGDCAAAMEFIMSMTIILKAGMAGAKVLQMGGDPVMALAAFLREKEAHYGLQN